MDSYLLCTSICFERWKTVFHNIINGDKSLQNGTLDHTLGRHGYVLRKITGASRCYSNANMSSHI